MFNGDLCSLCQSPYQDPRVLCCFHTLCVKCIKQNCTAPALKCPLCEFTTTCQSIDQLPKNVVVEGAMREKAGKRSCRNCSEKDGTIFCRQCSSSLCQACSDGIHGNEIFKGHELMPLLEGGGTTSPASGTSPSRRAESPNRSPSRGGKGGDASATAGFAGGVLESCSRHHGEALSLYCSVCHHSLCRECATDGVHRGHSPIYTVESHATSLTHDEVPKVFPICDDIVNKALKGMRAVDTALDEVAEQKQQATQDIHKEIDEMISRLNGRRKELLSRLEETAESKEQLLKKQRRTLEGMLHNMTHSTAVALTLLSKEKQNQQRQEALMRKLKGGGGSGDATSAGAPAPVALNTKQQFSASTVCNIAGLSHDYIKFLTAQRIDLAACVDSSIRANFSNGKDDILRSADCVGNIVAKQTMERHFHFTGQVEDHEGLLYYLGCNGGIQLYKNPTRLGHVVVAASSVGYGRSENVVAASRSQFCTQSEEGSWVQITLNRPFIVNHYTMQHDEYDADCHFLRSWLFQGFVPTDHKSPSASMNATLYNNNNAGDADGGVWITLSSHQNDSTVNSDHPYGDWAVQPPPASALQQQLNQSQSAGGGGGSEVGSSSEGTMNSSRPLPMTRFRILLTGPNSNGNHYLMLSALELYGTLVS